MGALALACMREAGEHGVRTMVMLSEKLLSSENRPKLVTACVHLIEREAAAKTGLGGMAVKTGFKVIQTISPSFVEKAVDALLPEFTGALEATWGRTGENGQAFLDYVGGHASETADALLTVTDARVARADNKVVQKTYDRMRGSAKDHVTAAVPGLVDTLQPFVW